MATKLDYSRLLDDEFLNRGERVRVRAVTLGSAQVLDTQWSRSRAALLCALLLSLTVILTIGLYIFTTMLMVSAHQSGMHMQVLGMLGGGAAPTPKAAALSSPALEAANESAGVDMEPRPSPFQVPVAMPVLSQDPPHEDPLHLRHPVEEHDAHLLAMTGHHEQADADDHDDHQDGEHSHPGDVILGDHHVEPAGDPDTTEHAVHALLLCLPGDNKQTAAASRPVAAALNLTRAQGDVVHSTVEFLVGRAQCHIVVLRNVGGEATRAEAPVRVAASNATATSIGSGPLAYFSSAGCGASSEDAVDDTAGAEYGGEVVLPTGRSLPVVLWDAAELFARSPLAAGWRELGHAATSVAHSKGLDLLELAARLQLLWRFGGVTVNLHASADQVLKTLSAFNRTDTQHVYLETTRAALVAAPQTCNAVVFELVRAVSKWVPITDGSEEHERDGDLRVFDGVLDDYCSGRREARSAAEERTSSPPPTSTSPSSTAISAEDESTESDSEESDESASEGSDTDSASTSGPRPTATSSQAAKMGKLSFRMLRAGRPAVTTTTPGPLPEDIRVDTTRCRGNLVAISLA